MSFSLCSRQYYFKYCSCIGSISISRELVRNAKFSSGLPRFSISGVELQESINKLSKRFLYTLKFEKQCSRASYPKVCFLWVINWYQKWFQSLSNELGKCWVKQSYAFNFFSFLGVLPDFAELLICYSTAQNAPLDSKHT